MLLEEIIEYNYTACLLLKDKLLMQCQHTDLDKLTAKVMGWLEISSHGAEGIIYDHNIGDIIGTYRKAMID